MTPKWERAVVAQLKACRPTHGFSLVVCVFIGTARPRPLIAFGHLGLPKPTDRVRRQSLELAPVVDGFFNHARVLDYLLRRLPWAGCNRIDLNVQTIKLDFTALALGVYSKGI